MIPPNLITNAGWPESLGGRKKFTLPEKKAKPKRKTKGEWITFFMGTPAAPEQTGEEKQVARSLFEKHDKRVVECRFPLPPSTNNAWETFVPKGSRRAVTHLSTCYTAYKEMVIYFWTRHCGGWPPDALTGRLRLLLTVHMASNRTADISNRIKSLEDALTNAGVWTDDGQVDEIRVIRGSVLPPTGAIDVIVEVIE